MKIGKMSKNEEECYLQLIEMYDLTSYLKLESFIEDYYAMKNWFEETKIMFEIYGKGEQRKG